MVTFDFSSLVHWNRPNPDNTHHVYFNIEPSFAEKVMDLLDTYEEEASTKNIVSTQDFLVGLSKVNEKELGPLTLPQMLFVVHASAWNFGYNTGFLQGAEEATVSYMESKFGHGKQVRPTNNKQATA